MSLRDRAAAKANSSTKSIIEGKEKITTEEIVKFYGGNVTIIDFDIITNKKGEALTVFIFREDQEKFFFGGKGLFDLINELSVDYDGIENLKEAVRDEGLAIKMTPTKTQAGRDYTAIEVL